MDAIAATTARVVEIQGTIAGLAARSATPSATKSAASFDAVFATAVAAADPTGAAGAYGAEQVANAATIVETGRAMGLSVRDQTIAVMTAMGESSLTVADHGDVAGPDSRGLFQQRANGAWGSLADRMDPATSAASFYTALAKVDGRNAMEPTLVAHAVQRNADPYHYTKYWDAAVAIVAQVSAAN
ncbi:hypothetical protein [Pengzhenrongella sicca]|uniref:Uncharacterized protein n=1 Tax=Pengzhenrongella sicca TaxID=2819238 RepID=A0A8A4ZMQ8_9MICO|nr:hypothetical protein [Pengzhenrongella sicca]QTE30848.1 hypothetical protein J4E96_07940 [Pengzhenrongella sicca]